MNNEFLIGIIALLVGAHYASMIWEIRRLRTDFEGVRKEIAELKNEIIKAALSASVAATNAAKAVAEVAMSLAQNNNETVR